MNSTAQEIVTMISEKAPFVRLFEDVLREHLGEAYSTSMVLAMGREISAKRKRKLQKRGEVIRFYRWTEAGSCRYKWLPAITVKTEGIA